ncbi:LpqB family beta-propeller domain-containing protein [Nocardioides sp. MAHUQ-72]|uniref:LpqB family beta-propeller domain-containing protein n=1 Tax=unclassified Nocardioides TaxID=2615069 RepID=UPI00361B5CF6
MSRRPAALLLALVVTLAPAVSGCVRMPESGPVVETRSGGALNDEPGIYIDPRPPEKGASAADIVKGFLDAMTATPIQTNVAKQFLAKGAQASWNPERSTITYADAAPPRLTRGSRVSVQLTGADHLDARGAWRGPLPRGAHNLQFPMTVENGEYRIASAPNALIVPEPWFAQRFREVSLYFFEPTAQVLVPEPVFVPRGEQLATALIKGLLRGPRADLARVSRSFIPPGLTFGLSVPVSAGGVADISLKGDAGPQTAQAVTLMMAQLAWTLRQEPAISALRVSIGGQQIQLPGGVSEVAVDQGAAYDPGGFAASSQLYGLRHGLLVAGEAGALSAVDGPLGGTQYGLRSVAVNLDATQAAGVSGEGDSVLVAPVGGATDEVRQVVSSASNLLTPAWDFADRIWLVDRAPGGAQVSYVEGGGPTSVRVPGLSGRSVKSFLVSRDGSRLVAVEHRRSGDALVVSRIRHDEQGRVLGATRAHRIAWEGGERLRIRDIAWRTPTTVAVLHELTDNLSQVRTIAVDGSPSGADSLATTLRGDVRSLAGSPVPSQSLYAVTGSSLIDLSYSERGSAKLDPGVTAIGYVG